MHALPTGTILTSIVSLQAVIDYNIIPQLIRMLETEDFDIRKECAWAISNATSGGDDMQIKYLVDQVRSKHEAAFMQPVSWCSLPDTSIHVRLPCTARQKIVTACHLSHQDKTQYVAKSVSSY